MTVIATWNVNSVRARLDNILRWLKDVDPDVCCLQEIKAQQENFPFMEFEALGYKVEIVGQKSYNGVAILAKDKIVVTEKALPLREGEEEDPQARYLEAQIGSLIVSSIYLPNGNPLGTEKFSYKLAWMERLKEQAQKLLEEEKPIILAGDFNLIPDDEDCYDPSRFKDDALFQPESLDRFREILYLGYSDAFRLRNNKSHQYSYWDYQRGAWQKDHGIRIDHFLLCPEAADLLEEVWIDKAPRGEEKASDHTPVLCRFKD